MICNSVHRSRVTPYLDDPPCPQVMKLKVDLLATLALKGTFTRTSSGFCLMELVDKVGDPKNGAAAMEALSCIAEGISLNYIGGEVSHMTRLRARGDIYIIFVQWK